MILTEMMKCMLSVLVALARLLEEDGGDCGCKLYTLYFLEDRGLAVLREHKKKKLSTYLPMQRHTPLHNGW